MYHIMQQICYLTSTYERDDIAHCSTEIPIQKIKIEKSYEIKREVKYMPITEAAIAWDCNKREKERNRVDDYRLLRDGTITCYFSFTPFVNAGHHRHT